MGLSALVLWRPPFRRAPFLVRSRCHPDNACLWRTRDLLFARHHAHIHFSKSIRPSSRGRQYRHVLQQGQILPRLTLIHLAMAVYCGNYVRGIAESILCGTNN